MWACHLIWTHQATVCCEIFINVGSKQIKVTKKTFFLVRWDLRLLFSSSQIYSCPYFFDQKFATTTALINFSALDLPKSAFIYSECQMNRLCCLLSLWPQNRSSNYLWTFLCLGMPKLKLPVWRRPKRCRPSFPKHRASNYPSLPLQALTMIKTKGMSPISECECYHHQSSTIHAAAVVCISCSSMSVWYWHSTFITEHWLTHITSSDALNSTSSIWQSRSLSSHLIPL